jgi:hypothetical protein
MSCLIKFPCFCDVRFCYFRTRNLIVLDVPFPSLLLLGYSIPSWLFLNFGWLWLVFCPFGSTVIFHFGKTDGAAMLMQRRTVFLWGLCRSCFVRFLQQHSAPSNLHHWDDVCPLTQSQSCHLMLCARKCMQWRDILGFSKLVDFSAVCKHLSFLPVPFIAMFCHLKSILNGHWYVLS